MLSFPLTPGDQTNVTSCGINVVGAELTTPTTTTTMTTPTTLMIHWNYRAFNGLCGGKFVKMIPGVCDETIDATGDECPLGGINPARCYGTRCECAYQRFRVVERMLSFPLTPGDQTNVTSCGVNGMVGGSRCYCNPGYVVTRDASGTKLSCTRSFLMQQRWGDRSGTRHHHIVV
nr:hypothetical protein BaRGS_010825 [Batillaria attramentaria]